MTGYQASTPYRTLTNGGAIPHSIDVHAARIAPNVAFRDVAPGESVHLPLQGERSRCLHVPLRDQAGARAHRERHVRSDRRRPGDAAAEGGPRVRAGRERVVHERRRARRAGLARHVEGSRDHAGLDDLQRVREPVRDAPLEAKTGETVRFYVVAAGPTLDTNFHVVGTVFDRAWVNQDMTQPQTGVQTVVVPAGSGAVFDVKIDEPGRYPFVSHAFAHVDLGQVGLLEVSGRKRAASR